MSTYEVPTAGENPQQTIPEPTSGRCTECQMLLPDHRSDCSVWKQASTEATGSAELAGA